MIQFQKRISNAPALRTLWRPWLETASTGITVVSCGTFSSAIACWVPPTYEVPSIPILPSKPRLLPDPIGAIPAVAAIVGHPVPHALGGVPAARVLGDEDVTARRVVAAEPRRCRSCCTACA